LNYGSTQPTDQHNDPDSCAASLRQPLVRGTQNTVVGRAERLAERPDFDGFPDVVDVRDQMDRLRARLDGAEPNPTLRVVEARWVHDTNHRDQSRTQSHQGRNTLIDPRDLSSDQRDFAAVVFDAEAEAEPCPARNLCASLAQRTIWNVREPSIAP
jgi:hypothetical protein